MTGDPGSGLLRYAGPVAVTILLAISFLLTVPGQADGSQGDQIMVRLSVEFEENNRGSIEFSMGNIIPSSLEETDKVPLYGTPYKNDNMDRLLKTFRTRGRDNESYFRMVLNPEGDVTLEDTAFYERVERNYFVIRMVTNFTCSSKGIDAEYTFLDLVKRVDDQIGRENGESLIDYNLRRIRELDRINVKLEIKLAEGLSMTTIPRLSGHSRAMSSESLSETMGSEEIISGTNELKVYDHVLLSPGFAFFSAVFYLLIGSGLLGFIWYRNRFRGVGLILPIITILSLIFLLFNYTTPSINFNALGSATVWIWGVVSLGLVIACNYVNPKPRFRSYDEEVKDQPRLKMPKVVYVDRQVLVEKRVRMTEEEAMDPYEVLEVSKRATFEEIEKAYKSKVKEYHPDKFDGTPKRIHEAARKETERLNMAYDKLKRQHRR